VVLPLERDSETECGDLGDPPAERCVGLGTPGSGLTASIDLR